MKPRLYSFQHRSLMILLSRRRKRPPFGHFLIRQSVALLSLALVHTQFLVRRQDQTTSVFVATQAEFHEVLYVSLLSTNTLLQY